MNFYQLHWRIAIGTALAFLIFTGLNHLIFQAFEHVRGIDWVYLPAGIRLLCTLLFGLTGAIGLFLGSCVVTFSYYFPDDPARAMVGSLVSALGPYIAYLLAQKTMRLRPTLSNLTAAKLLACAWLYAMCNATLHLISFQFFGKPGTDPWHSTLIMFLGDLSGTLIIVYLSKHILSASRRYRRIRRRVHHHQSRTWR